MLRFKEKGGKEKELPVHHKLEELLDQYLKATGLEKEPGSPLFPAANCPGCLRKLARISRSSALSGISRSTTSKSDLLDIQRSLRSK